MSVKDGLPATDFSRMNREYIRNVAEGETVKDGLPATDFSRMNREYIKAVVEEAAGGGGGGGDESPFQMTTVTLNIGSGLNIKSVEFTGYINYPAENPDSSNDWPYAGAFVFGNTNSPSAAPDLDSIITFELPLYNGIGYLDEFFSAYTTTGIQSTHISLSGNAEIENDPPTNFFYGKIKVTGECTITITWE